MSDREMRYLRGKDSWFLNLISHWDGDRWQTRLWVNPACFVLAFFLAWLLL